MLKAAFIWYKEYERDELRRVLDPDPNWDLVCIHERSVSNVNKALGLLDSTYDIVIIHLTLPSCLSLKMAEYVHSTNKRTKLVLFSGTHASPNLLSGLFDGCFSVRTDDIGVLPELLRKVVERKRSRLPSDDIRKRIVTIMNESTWLQKCLREATGERHPDRFLYEDYLRSIESTAGLSPSDVFISYCAEDSEIAKRVCASLEKHGVNCFMAERSLSSGERWENRILIELKNAREVIFIFTDRSVHSDWVLAELGAAWVLDKHVTPCTRGILPRQLPGPAILFQATSIENDTQFKALSQEIATRLGKNPAG